METKLLQPLRPQSGLLPIIEIFIIAAVIIAAGFTGYRVYDARMASKTAVKPPSSTSPPSDQPAPTSGSGVYGRVTQGPGCSASTKTDSGCNDRALQTELIVIPATQTDVYPSRKPAPVARFSSNSRGHFRASLPPGEYFIELPNPPSSSGSVANTFFTVKPQVFTEVNLYYNTGHE